MRNREKLSNIFKDLIINEDELLIIERILGMEEDKLEDVLSLLNKAIVKNNEIIKEVLDTLDRINDYASCMRMVTNYKPVGSPSLIYATRVCNRAREEFGMERKGNYKAELLNQRNERV